MTGRLGLLAELFARFAGVGIVFALLNFGLLWLLISAAGLNYLLACVISFVLLTGLSCVTSKRHAFLQESTVDFRELARFAALAGASLVANLAIMAVLVGGLGWPPLAASVIVTVVLALVNFVGHLLITFRVDLGRLAARRVGR